MSGIAAVFETDGRPVAAALLERMLAAIAHRGPDGIGRFVDGPIALGRAILRTTPEASWERPVLADAAARLALAFHGRVDNREELARAIAGAGGRVESGADSELVLRAYQCWGEEAAGKILGDFAFALWDGNRGRLFCARDPVGAIPLHYWHNGRGLRVATELQQLFADPAVPRHPNEAMVVQHLADRHLDRAQTLFRGVLRLPPAHSMVVDREGIKVRRYYDLDPGREIRYRSDDQYAEHFFEVFREAVRCRLRTDGAIGSYLSGGLDSSSIVCMAQALYRDGAAPRTRFETYSLLYPPPADERDYIRAVIEMWRLPSNTPAPAVLELETARGQALRYHDLSDLPNGAMANSLRALAQAQGVRVMLDGRGGDEWLDGSSQYYADLIREFRLAALLRDVRADARGARADSLSFNPLTAIARRGLMPLVPPRVLAALKSALGRGAPARWLRPEFIRRSGLRENALDELKRGAHVPGFARRELYRTFAVDAFQTRIQELVERSSAEYGLEMRCPFYDRRLIEFCFAIPQEERRRPGQTKFVMRNAMRGLLPEIVRMRLTKAIFSDAFYRALRRPAVERLFNGPLRIESMGWVEGARLREAYRTISHPTPTIAKTAHLDVWPLWAALGTELWLRSVILREDSSQV